MEPKQLNDQCAKKSSARVLSLGIVAVVGLSAGSVSAAGLSGGLDGYWTFDEMSGGILHDSSGHGYDGSLVNFPGGQGNWDGKIDDLAIWTRALSSQELAGIYSAGLAGKPLSALIPEPSVPALFGWGILLVAGIRSAGKS